MRLIDADALKETMRGEFIDHIEEYRAITIVNDAPTIEAVPKDFHDKTCEAMAKAHQEEIADMVSVVRCKECKYCVDAGAQRALVCDNSYIDMDIHPDDFCSYGERKEDE